MKSCFVISPIGMPGSEQREHADDAFDFIIKPATERAGYAAKRADHESRPGTITEQMYDSILGDDLLIAVLTYHNPNVFYEVAIAEAAARPLILMIEKGHTVPFDIADRRVIFYDLKPRKLFKGDYADELLRTITELKATGGFQKVPFRPSLKPLGAGEAAWRIVSRSEDVPRESLLDFVREAKSFAWFQGIALFAFPKIVGFEEILRQALADGLEARVLLMHPDNPALEYVLRDFAPNYADLVRKEIQAGAAFWQRFSDAGALRVRYHRKGAMFGNVLQNDVRIIYTQYSLARSTSESPTIIAPAGVPFYESNRQDFEWLWNRAIHDIEPAPLSQKFTDHGAKSPGTKRSIAAKATRTPNGNKTSRATRP